MSYYKLINDSGFIGVATDDDLRRFQTKHRILLTSDLDRAQYISVNDKHYRAKWMVPVVTDIVAYIEAEVIKISEEEYNELFEAVESGEDIIIEPDEPIIEEPAYIDPIETVTVDFLKKMKVEEMSKACNTVITNGFDIVLSDGNTYHYSLTTHDQLNLMSLASLAASGENQIPYHADGELCRFYSAEDILAIVNGATRFKTYQVSYFNSLKAYIETLTDFDEVAAVEYGMAIPEGHQSEVLATLLAGMGEGE